MRSFGWHYNSKPATTGGASDSAARVKSDTIHKINECVVPLPGNVNVNGQLVHTVGGFCKRKGWLKILVVPTGDCLFGRRPVLVSSIKLYFSPA